MIEVVKLNQLLCNPKDLAFILKLKILEGSAHHLLRKRSLSSIPIYLFDIALHGTT